MKRETVRHVILGIGIYAVARLLASILLVSFGAVIDPLWPMDRSGHEIVTPLLTSLSDAIAAAMAGCGMVWLVEDSSPARWAMVPAGLWLLAALNEVVVVGPSWIAVVPQVVAATLPAIACVAAARAAAWHAR